MSMANFKRAVALVLAVLMLTTPLLAQQEDITAKACADAKKDAEAETSSALWFIAGCLGGWLGLLIAHVYSPSPPAARLVGKSPEYVAAYTDCYKKRAKEIQTKNAWTGCGIYAAAVVVYAVLVVAAAGAE